MENQADEILKGEIAIIANKVLTYLEKEKVPVSIGMLALEAAFRTSLVQMINERVDDGRHLADVIGDACEIIDESKRLAVEKLGGKLE